MSSIAVVLRKMIFLLFIASILSVTANGAINPLFGIHGFPDCVQPSPFSPNNVAANQMSNGLFPKQGQGRLSLSWLRRRFHNGWFTFEWPHEDVPCPAADHARSR